MKRAFFIIIMVMTLPAPALAHPETGFLPDAIAETEYKMVVQINPADIATRNRLGIVLYRKNKLKEAEEQFREILKIAPRDFDAHDGMGLVKIKERDFPTALAWVQKAIALSEADTMVRYNLGLIYEMTGRFREADGAYRQALAVNDRNLQKGVNRDLEASKRKIIEIALTGLKSKLKVQ
ncbi:MAG TPA: tetratricopeptide repeat protein [Geobacteraceae bacterium]|nr:tetratricopeptide repeat protein [Geobacteraceae bacterium]